MCWVRGSHLCRCPGVSVCAAARTRARDDGMIVRASVMPCRAAHARARGTMAAMLEGTLPTTRDASPAEAGESVLELREVIERMHAGLRFEKTRNAAPNFEVARLKRWRFGSSSESLEATTQAPSSNHPRSTPSGPTPCSGTSRRNRRASPNPRHRQQSARRFARRCRPTCRASTITTSPCKRTAPAARRSSASAKRSARNWTRPLPSSSCCAISAASTLARAARRFRPHRCPRR